MEVNRKKTHTVYCRFLTRKKMWLLNHHLVGLLDLKTYSFKIHTLLFVVVSCLIKLGKKDILNIHCAGWYSVNTVITFCAYLLSLPSSINTYLFGFLLPLVLLVISLLLGAKFNASHSERGYRDERIFIQVHLKPVGRLMPTLKGLG